MARIPESIDKYRLESLIASGGMGEVYKGIHPTLERPVILKKLTLRGDVGLVERFRREARILMSFRSDHIVDVYDHFKKGPNHYIVMEFVDGVSVQGLLARERYLDNAVSALVALAIARGLAYAHGKNVIHRDIKPDNVLISKQGEVKLADFGIATSREEEGANLTSAGMTLGTPSYMAPEQFEDSRTVDGRADLYSLGVVLYEMLTGHKPYPGRFSPELVRTIQTGIYRKPRRINPAVAPELERVVAMLMKPNPRRRCADAAVVIRRIEGFLSRYDAVAVSSRLQALVAGKDTAPLRPRRRGRAGRRIAAVVAVAGLLAAGAAWCGLTGLHRRLLFPGEFGQVRFIVEGFPAEVRAAEVRVTVSAADTPADGEVGGEGVVRPRIVSALARWPGDPPSVIVTSLPLALRAGEYRAAATVGDREITALFFVRPWSEHREVSKIGIPLVDSGPRTLVVTAEVVDADSGSSLSGAAEVEVLDGSVYVPLEQAGLLVSGRVLTFRIRVPGYPARVVVVPVATDTGSLTITAEMRAIGGER